MNNEDRYLSFKEFKKMDKKIERVTGGRKMIIAIVTDRETIATFANVGGKDAAEIIEEWLKNILIKLTGEINEQKNDM